MASLEVLAAVAVVEPQREPQVILQAQAPHKEAQVETALAVLAAVVAVVLPQLA
jgi:hypothetical protein